jgi:hypothetical protein
MKLESTGDAIAVVSVTDAVVADVVEATSKMLIELLA